ncbi:guanylate kinase [Lacticaseibacillus pabuli]|uniref:Guanylate kinase n=1 Tax=Lacticaseibacillus pabuli TaxID=3025672 RepID=A0ABY7WSK0_9LACO|nr:guanylate kinase [Lacticaseibacillus sp. KACC 23028]WDF83160.1 guanylate kinase [Lacticaseibacillus sp. KACC 23028]
MTKKTIIVITGATGTGKTTVQKYLRDKYDIPAVITHTTRPMRVGERNGVDYYFETPESFLKNHYLEYVTYAHYQYGSSHEGLARTWAEHDVASIVLDTAGALTYVHELGDQAAVLFLTVDNHASLRHRLLQRGDAEPMVTKRLASPEYGRDLVLPIGLRGVAKTVVNDDWQLAKQKIDQFVKGLLADKSQNTTF